jgi:hypothetical protein
MKLVSASFSFILFFSEAAYAFDLPKLAEGCRSHFAADTERLWKIDVSFNFFQKSDSLKQLQKALNEETRLKPYRLYIEVNPHIEYAAFLLEVQEDDYCTQTYHTEHGNHLSEAGECILPLPSALGSEPSKVKAENKISSAIGTVIYIEKTTDKGITARCSDEVFAPTKFLSPQLFAPRLKNLRAVDRTAESIDSSKPK